jgi:xanthine dehydrogenase YagR molybdenum-binding subunit
MTTIEKPQEATRTEYIGRGVPRRDGLAKATGTARYTFDITLPDMVYGTIVSATIPRGRVARVDHSRAQALPGVLLVLSSENQEPTPPREEGGKPYIWFNRTISYDGQDVAFVVATTQQIADEAARLVAVEYEEDPAVTTMRAAMRDDAPSVKADGTPNVEFVTSDDDAAHERGDIQAGLDAAQIALTLQYDMPMQTHNPWEAHVTVAAWNGDDLTVYDSVQYPFGARRTIADALGIAPERVRVIAEHVGGAFGAKLSTKSQAPLAALAARELGRPVRARLTREQMNRNARYRPATLHEIRIGADLEGRLTALAHDVWSSGSVNGDYYERGAITTQFLYACPNLSSKHYRVRFNHQPPGSMRAPGEMQNQFALETALDELAAALGMDPIELRRRNHTDIHPISGKPFSRKPIIDLLERGAGMIGWQERALPPGSRRDGPRWRGIGCAVAFYPLWREPAKAEVVIGADGRVTVKSSAVDLGTGTYTVLAQVAADGLGADLDDIVMALGDTDLPQAPVSGGSMTVPSVAPAVYAAAQDARAQLIAAALALPDQPFGELSAEYLTTAASSVCVAADPARALPFATIARATGQAITSTAEYKPQNDEYEVANFGAHFAEVEVDVATGYVSVLRFAAVHDSGRVLNAATFRSQLYGGIIQGISNALLEETRTDARRGRVLNPNLTDYLVPTSLDVGQIEVAWLSEPDDNAGPLGIKSAGEVGITGAAPAIGNAVFNATGVRLRRLPFRPQYVLPELLAAGIAD